MNEQTRGAQLKRSEKGEEEERSGRKLVVTIGIDSYQHLPGLGNAVNDARSVQRLFVDRLGYTAPFDPLVNKEATGQAISTLILDRLRQTLQPDDTLVIFFSGHGAVRRDERGGSVGFLVPIDAREEEWSSYLRIDTLLDEISRLPALHVLVIIDTCFSGYALGGTFARQVEAGKSGRPASRRVITSARADQLALDGNSEQGNSPFTTILLDAFVLQENDVARADFDRNGAIIGIELGLFVQLEFGKTSQYAQMPDFGAFHHDERGEFVIARRGMMQKPDDANLIAIIHDAQNWLRSRGDRAYLYRGGQLSDALAWRKGQQDAEVRDEVDTFLNASRQWRALRRLAAVGAVLLIIALLYLAGNAVYKWRLKVDAEAETAVFQPATVRLGVEGESIPVGGFELDVHEVSERQYRLCYRAGTCEEPAGIPDYEDRELTAEAEQLPVVNVSAFNARDYCAWQGGRLPTAAEWEYAVRGTAYRKWPWGEEDPAPDRVNINLHNLRNTPDPSYFSHSLVAVQDPAYAGGITDEEVWHLAGNAREWTGTLVADCPFDERGIFEEVFQCSTWDNDDSVTGLFAAGLSYKDELVPEDPNRVSTLMNTDATVHRDYLGFRCAYDQD